MLTLSIIPLAAALATAASDPITAAPPDPTASYGPTDVEGYWRTDDGDTVHVYPCGDESMCGRVVASPNIAPGAPMPTDENNPNPALRDRPVIGLVIIEGFEKTPSGWRRGAIYDPFNGKTYRSAMIRIGADRLKLQGCIGPFCRKLIWTPGEAPG